MSVIKKLPGDAVVVKLVGGLGNQLFGYFAGLDVAKSQKLNLNLDVTDIRYKFGVHDVSIESFDLDGRFFSRNVSGKLISRILNKTTRLLNKITFPTRDYFSNVIGYDPKIFKQPAGTILNGYFQTYIHYRNVQKNLNPISVRYPSKWFLDKSKIISKTDVLAIHVRRGDYERLSYDYGLLSREYYKFALLEFDKYVKKQSIWVFSDDIVKAKELLQDLVPEQTEWIDPAEVQDDAEVLLLMSKANSFVIANSTFSWWAAMLRGTGANVVAPKKWYRNMEDPNDFIPPEWKTIESQWEI